MRARTWVLARSSSAFSRAVAALRSRAFCSSLPPCCSRARCTSALGRRHLADPPARGWRATSRGGAGKWCPGRRGTGVRGDRGPAAPCSSLASAARCVASAESMPAVLAAICRRVDSRSARARSTAIWYCSRVHLEEQRAGLDHLVVAHLHLGHPAGHLGGHRHDEGLHARLLGVGREAVGQQVPEQAEDDQPRAPRRTRRLGRPARGAGPGGRRFCGSTHWR